MATATLDLALAFIGDGYLVAVMTSEEYEDTPWGQHLESDESFEEAFAHGVPRNLAEQLLRQGCSDQWFDDGYTAASAVAPYVS